MKINLISNLYGCISIEGWRGMVSSTLHHTLKVRGLDGLEAIICLPETEFKSFVAKLNEFAGQNPNLKGEPLMEAGATKPLGSQPEGNPTVTQLKEVLAALNKCYADIMDAQVVAADIIDDTTNNIIGSAKSYLGQAIDVIWEKFNK